MKIKKLKDLNPSHRLFVRIIDRKKGVTFDEYGQRWVNTLWVEMQSINLGSVNKPNRDILRVNLDPVEYEKPDKKPEKFPYDYFKRYFDDED